MARETSKSPGYFLDMSCDQYLESMYEKKAISDYVRSSGT